MAAALLALQPFFPWDRVNESVLGHHHLIAAYFFTWGLQLVYLAYIAVRWRNLARAKRSHLAK